MCIRDRCKTLAHSRLSPFASTNDIIAPATFLPFTTFLLHSASSVPFSSNMYTKYLNPDTCFSCSPSNITSHRGLSSLTTITLLLSTLTSKHLLLHTLPNLSTNPLKLSQIRHTKANHPHIIGSASSTLFHSPSF